MSRLAPTLIINRHICKGRGQFYPADGSFGGVKLVVINSELSGQLKINRQGCAPLLCGGQRC